MIHRQLILISAFTLVASSFSVKMISTKAQTASGRGEKTAGIPSQLQPSLDEGVRRFVEAQAAGQWDEVAKFLGRFRGSSRGTLYTEAHKECLLSQMRAMPMISFVRERVFFRTEILSTPTSKRWWFFTGVAEFKTTSGTAKSQAQITAYRDHGKWYFTPPSYDDEWERDRITEADFAGDKSTNISIELDPACPVEIRDFSVIIDREYLSLRRLNFTLKNKTKKKIVGYGLRLGTVDAHCFGFMQGSPTTIEPKGTAPASEVKYSAYVYYCQGESKRRLVIDSVSFADGSTWRDPRFQKNRIPKDCSF